MHRTVLYGPMTSGSIRDAGTTCPGDLPSAAAAASGSTIDRTGTLAFVPTRFGPGVIGGAEMVLAQMSRRLMARGWDVEVLTTCAVDHYTWANVLQPGRHDDAMPVRRFPVVLDQGGEHGRLEHAIVTGQRLSLSEQQAWMNGGMRSPELFHHLLDNAAQYRAIVLGPYPNWITFSCAQIAPERSVLWTCLHDEPYAHLDVFEPVLTGVGGLLFQTPPEHRLAHRLVPDALARHAVVGCGVEVPERYDAQAFRHRHGIEGRFVLYAGRREGAKGWEVLLGQLARAFQRRRLPFSLVTMGVGEVRPPDELADRVIDVGVLPEAERDAAFAAADAYIQSSTLEAFSRTVMEAWLAGTPVIANGGSEVVRYHCEQSGAGLVYADEYELEECLAFVAEAPDAARALAAGGRRYVLDNYQWDTVLDRVETALTAWTA